MVEFPASVATGFVSADWFSATGTRRDGTVTFKPNVAQGIVRVLESGLHVEAVDVPFTDGLLSVELAASTGQDSNPATWNYKAEVKFSGAGGYTTYVDVLPGETTNLVTDGAAAIAGQLIVQGPQGRRGPQGLPGLNAIPTDDAIATYALTPGTATADAVAAVIEDRSGWIDARLHGVKADGVTDDSAAWNALVQSVPTGTTLTWHGTSILRDQIVWRGGVSIVGKGWGKSILATVDDTGQKYFSAIDFTPTSMGASVDNPVVDCRFADFEIDGSGISGPLPHIGSKGIFGQFMRRCQFSNLLIRETIGTGLGTDYMADCLINGVMTINCGRNWKIANGGGGQAGIGVGTGAWEDESLTISDCHTISTDPVNRPAHWGIFVEWQSNQPYRGRGIRIVGCSATGADCGFGDRGTAGTIMTGNTAYNNRLGFHTAMGTIDGLVANNVAYNNAEDGFSSDPTIQGRCVWRGNKSYENGRGYYFGATGNVIPHLTFDGNEAYDNRGSGLQFASSAVGGFTDLVLRSNRAWNNGTESANQYTNRGIRVDANLTRFSVSDNDCTDTQAVKTQHTGMTFGSAFSLTDGRIVGNVLIGNGTRGLDLGTNRTRVRVADNSGYATEADGAATIPDGSATATVTHGLAGTPTTVILGKRTAADVWVSARTATTFTLTRTGTTGAVTVDWTATYRP
ncbi:hypothetical protein ACQBAU_16385 [Propionibacteriaceae bacterium Y2011]